MGQTSSTLFPTEMVDCKTTTTTEDYSTNRDARREYACTSDPKLRWPMTIVCITYIFISNELLIYP